MASVANPMFSGVVPGGMNPTGNQLSLLGLPNTGGKGTNAMLPGATPASASTPVSSNPFDVSSSPSFPANTGGGYPTGVPGGPPTNIVAPMPPSNTWEFGTSGVAAGFGFPTNPAAQNNLAKTLTKTYGKGMGTLIYNFLASGAGFNQQAINNLLASLQPGIERGEEDLMSQFSASGNRFGSGAQVGLGDFLSKVNLNEGELETQMYQSALDNFINVMMGSGGKTAETTASSPSLFDNILSGIGLGGQAASGASSIISAINPGADTGILDAIAGAAAFA